MKEDWRKDELKPMRNPVSLNLEELNLFLTEYKEWKLEENIGRAKNRLTREIHFSNFIQAFGYVSKIALLSEKLDHHAEIFNSYGLVKISLFTHTTNDITYLDRLFAFHAELLI